MRCPFPRGKHPGGHSARLVALWTDHHVCIVGGLDQPVECRTQCPAYRGQLVERDPPMAGFDAAEIGRTQVAAPRQFVE